VPHERLRHEIATRFARAGAEAPVVRRRKHIVPPV